MSLNANRFGIYLYSKEEFEKELSTEKEDGSFRKSLNKNLIKGLFGEFEDNEEDYREKLDLLRRS